MSRRSLLHGGLGVAAIGLGGRALAGCGDPGTVRAGGGPKLDMGIVSPNLAANVPQRLVFVLRNKDNDLIAPTGLEVRVSRSDTKLGVLAPAEVHTDAAPAPAYVSATVTIPDTGVSYIQVRAKEGTAVGAIQAVVAPRGVQTGQAMPAVPTPTVTDALGIEALCTHIPPCDLHTMTLGDALKTNRPLAVLVATPAFCQTAVCGPVLDILLSNLPKLRPDLLAMHLEVYAKRPSGPEISATPLSPAVRALGLESEPVLFLVGANGIVAAKLDGIVGTAELTRAVGALP